MNDDYKNYLSRIDLIKNQVERERLREQRLQKTRKQRLQKQQLEKHQQLLQAELTARMFASVHGTGGGTTLDADAQAFITAAAITDLTQQSAVNQLVIDLKADGVWSKMKAIYPFVGGTATTHKFNLKNPLDTDAAFRIQFFGGVTHDSNGIQGNAINSYGNTFFIPNSHLSASSQHISIYSRTNSSGTFRDIGVSTSGLNTLACTLRWSDNNLYFNNGAGFASVSNLNSQGFYISNKIVSGTVVAYKNGASVASALSADALATHSSYIMAWNAAGSAQSGTSRQYSFASIGDGLTDTEAANLNTRITTFQTTLNRQV